MYLELADVNLVFYPFRKRSFDKILLQDLFSRVVVFEWARLTSSCSPLVASFSSARFLSRLKLVRITMMSASDLPRALLFDVGYHDVTYNIRC